MSADFIEGEENYWPPMEEEALWYAAYLKSDWWQFVRRNCMERAASKGMRNTCERCNRRPALEVHHLTYERLGAEMPEDVIAVCRQCHAELHGRPPPFSDEHGGWQGMPEILHVIIKPLGRKLASMVAENDQPA